MDPVDGARIEEALAGLLYDAAARARLRAAPADPRFASLDPEELEETARAVRRMVLARVHRGTGGIEDWFPATLAAWRAAHADDADLDGLAARFCASAHCLAWREHDTGVPGRSLEEALYGFFEEAEVGEAAVREDELLGALLRSLAVTPDARFVWPPSLRRAPGGCYALSATGILHAALDGRYLRGPVTPLVAALLAGGPPPDPSGDLEPVRESLRRMRLLA